MNTPAKIILALLLSSTQAPLSAREAAPRIVSTAKELAAIVDNEKSAGIEFDIDARVTFPIDGPCNMFAVEDATGFATIRKGESCEAREIRPGDRIHAKGFTRRHDPSGFIFADVDWMEVVSHGKPPSPVQMDWDGLHDGKYDNRLVEVEGIVRDAFRDEIDRTWDYLQLQCGPNTVYACFKVGTNDETRLQQLIDATVSVVGIYTPHKGMRRMIGNTIYTTGWETLAIVNAAPSDPFDVPSLSDAEKTSPTALNGMGRRRTKGRVIAVWHGDRMLLRTADGTVARVDLADQSPPNIGAFVEAAGRPETDLYRLNLSRAIWRPAESDGADEPPPVDATVKQLTTTPWGKRAFQTDYHGKAIRMKGQVRNLPEPDGDGRLGLECDRQIVPVDASSCPDALDGVEVGCTLQVAGVCIMETDNWHPNAPFPHIEGFAIVVRTRDDIQILSRPPWWTPGRLMAVIGALLAALFGIFAWNRMLNRRAERRGQELADEKVAHVTSDLKVYERTRLAVELHDSLSQNLTGVSLAIRAANRIADSNPDIMRQHLGLAAKTLDSCRDELRNCLWDLRNQTLEEADMNEAIRQTLKPHVGSARLSIRFNVPRERLSDNTAHAILRIVRELAANAVRHGAASAIKVAGAIENDRLLFSVTDNGTGFDPDSCPDAMQGHFGLQGIRDRVDAFEGEMSIRSAPGNGAKISISLKVKRL